MPVLPHVLTLFLPLVMVLFSAWFTDAHLPKWINSLLTTIVVLIISSLWALFSNSLVGDLSSDILVILAYSASVMSSPFLPLAQLHQSLQGKILSPIAAIANTIAEPEPIPISPPPFPSGKAPQPLTLPSIEKPVNALRGGLQPPQQGE